MLHAALIGFPSTGKSTLFQLMTSAKDAPKGKGDTVVGISKVPDPRLDRLTAMFNPKKRVPATIEFTDIVAADAPGRPLWSTSPATRAPMPWCMSSARSAIPRWRIPPVRRSRPRCPGHGRRADPCRPRRGRTPARAHGKGSQEEQVAELDKEKDLLLKCQTALESGQPLRALGLAGEDLRRLRGFQLLSAKPLLVVINLDETAVEAAASVERAAEVTGMKAFLSREGTRAVPLCAKIELEIAALEPADAEAFLKDMGLSESGLDRVIRASYDLLGYMSFFTVGEDECRAWSIRRGTIALDAAGEIHSDISRGFIRAEVVGYDPFIANGSLAASRDKGELRLEGKEYIVKDGDIINFRHAT